MIAPRLWLQRPLVVVGFLTLLAAVLRLVQLGYRSLWYDEAMLWWIASGSPAEVLARNAAVNSAPPLYALLIHLVCGVNDSEAGLRAISAAAGIAAVPATYALARALLGQRAAYGSAALVAVSPGLVFYSQQMREYSLAFLLATLMLVSFARFARSASWPAWAALLATWSLGLAAQYGLALLALALNSAFLGVLLARAGTATPRRLLARWVAAQALLLVVVAAVYVSTLRYQLRAGGFAGDAYLASSYWDGSPASLWRLALNSFNLVRFAFDSWPPFLALLMLGAWQALRRRQRLLWAICGAPIAVTFAAALLRLYPYDGIRQTIYLAPMLYVVAGLGIDQLQRLPIAPLLARGIVAGTLALGLVGSAQYLTLDFSNTRPVVAGLPALLRPGDRIYVYYGAVPAYRYYARHWRAVPALYGARDRRGLYAQADAITRQPGRIWMLFSHCNNTPTVGCQDLLDYVRRRRSLEQSLAASEVYLVLAR